MAFKWYIIHVHSGFEKKVIQSIKEQAEQKGITPLFGKIISPTEDVVEVLRGQKKKVERKFLPGYLLIEMELTDASWHLVKNTQKVTGFLGSGGKPQPVPDAEAERIFRQMAEGMEHPRNAVSFEVGEAVKVVEGPFESFVGNIEEVNDKDQTVKVSVSIFGRATPVELGYGQVEKV